MENKKASFIVFDGPDGAGKTTQIRRAEEYLKSVGINPIVTREPGGDELGLKIRQMLLYRDDMPQGSITPKAELLLFCADRANHRETVILPALNAGRVVLCDRYTASSYAYQVYAREVCSYENFWWLTQFATQGLLPSLWLWIDVPAEVGHVRFRKVQEKKADYFEKEDLEFRKKVRLGYKDFFTKYAGSPVTWIDGEQSEEEVFSQIKRALYFALRDTIASHFLATEQL